MCTQRLLQASRRLLHLPSLMSPRGFAHWIITGCPFSPFSHDTVCICSPSGEQEGENSEIFRGLKTPALNKNEMGSRANCVIRTLLALCATSGLSPRSLQGD